MMIRRMLRPVIESWLFRNKTIVLYGARQVGKTTLVRDILRKYEEPEGYYNCEVESVRQALSREEPTVLRRYFGEKRIIVLDEAQYVPNIGRILKLLSDHLPELQVIATGSSSFELANQTSEALTGRALTFVLYPISYLELSQVYDPIQLPAMIPGLMTLGTYPEIVKANEQEAKVLLDDLASKYLYKDVLEFENLKRRDIIFNLLQLLAHQIGHEVSLNELANTLKTNRRTVERYIDLLEKAFVIFRLRSFSRNLRKEIAKGFKIYFYDLGIRNSIIQQFQSLDIRHDVGGIWENYVVVERRKLLARAQIKPNQYFWRTHQRQEIDYIEEYNGWLYAYEIKWKPQKLRVPRVFQEAYPDSSFTQINKEHFEDFVTKFDLLR